MSTTDSTLRRDPARDDRITVHFRAREFDCHDGTPVPRSAHAALRRLCEEYLEPMRQRFGAGIVVSGYRHRRYNDRVGGAARSRHVYDEHPGEVAADVRFARGTAKEWADEAERLGASGVGRYERSGFVHVDTRRGSPAHWTG